MTRLESIQAEIAALQETLAKTNTPFRPPPPIPTICCGRGCSGCVWDGYYNAASWWVEEAIDLLSAGLIHTQFGAL